MSALQVAVIQQNITQSKNKNINNSIKMIKNAKKRGAELIVLQELHTSIYFCHIQNDKYFELAESISGDSIKKFQDIAKKLEVVLVISIFEKKRAGVYHNTAVVIETDGSKAGIYRKMHIPDDPGFNEKFYFTPGDLGFEPIETSVGKLGVLVCWDQWFPEAARIMALKGAQILIYPTAIGWDENDSKNEKKRQLNAWKIVQQSHAVANGIPVLVANRVGFDEKIVEKRTKFWGNSFICGEQGEILKIANSKKEAVLIAKIKKNRCDKVRRIWPFFRDRRVDNYKDLLKI